MEILNTVQPTQEGGALFFAVMIGMASLLFLALTVYAIKDRVIVASLVVGSMFVLTAFGSIAAFVDYITPDPTRYEVLITDMSKFDTSKYQIVEQRGKIFVVKEIGQ